MNSHLFTHVKIMYRRIDVGVSNIFYELIITFNFDVWIETQINKDAKTSTRISCNAVSATIPVAFPSTIVNSTEHIFVSS